MSDFQAVLLLMGGACAAMGMFLHYQRALSRRGLILALAATAAITGFLYWAQ